MLLFDDICFSMELCITVIFCLIRGMGVGFSSSEKFVLAFMCSFFFSYSTFLYVKLLVLLHFCEQAESLG